MRFGNPDILQAFVDLADPWDFQAFLKLCADRELITDFSEREYFQYAGMALGSAKKHPELSSYDAYMKFVSAVTVPASSAAFEVTAAVPIAEVPALLQAKCGSCGGGKVR